MTLTNKNAFQKEAYLPLFTVRGVSVQGVSPLEGTWDQTETSPQEGTWDQDRDLSL